jgi:hypothetical protein
MSGDRSGSREVYFEFTTIGGTVKVVAIDAASGTEVTVMGPARTPQGDMQRLALQKLMARLAREQ